MAAKTTEVGPCIRGCQRLGAPRKACDRCLAKRRAWNRENYRARAARGQCVCCQGVAEVGLFCFTHWLKNLGTAHGLGSKKGIQVLRDLWSEQRGRCAVTGDLLTPGLNASIDHVVPKSRGGDSQKGNLRWVLLQVNRIKWDMTHDEFIAVCRRVVAVHDRQAQETTMSALRSN